MSKFLDDLTKDEAQLITALRAAKTAGMQDFAELVTDAKATLSPVYTAAQQVLNGTPAAVTNGVVAPVPPAK